MKVKDYPIETMIAVSKDLSLVATYLGIQYRYVPLYY